jgi:hypothetical protein
MGCRKAAPLAADVYLLTFDVDPTASSARFFLRQNAPQMRRPLDK